MGFQGTTATTTTTAICLHRCLLLLLLLSSLLVRPGSALKWVRFDVPEWAARGKDATLTCQFDLANDRLYSVKWYKAGREFYRFVPADYPQMQNFPFPGVTVDKERSNEQHVILKGVNRDTAGRYKCEVLTEAPLFKTLVKSGALTVYELPDGGPEVTGGREQYRPGELVNLTCTAPHSIPATTLTWFINDQQAPQDYLIEYGNPEDREGRVSSRLGLQFRAREWHFPDGRLTLRCSATLHRLYQQEARHEGVVAPPDPLSLGHDASGCRGLVVGATGGGGGDGLLLLVTVLLTGLALQSHYTHS